MSKISSLPEARRAIDGIVKSLAEVQEFMASVEALTAQLTAMTIRPVESVRAQIFKHVVPSSSDTFTSKVIQIVLSDGPIRTRDIVRKYREMGFTFDGDDTKLYNSVSACVSYLVKKKGVLARSDAGYIPAPEKDLIEENEAGGPASVHTTHGAG